MREGPLRAWRGQKGLTIYAIKFLDATAAYVGMAGKRRGNAYGIGCITTKRTGPTMDTYVYAEWSVNGRHHCKSCGNSARPGSYLRARVLLRGILRERIAVLEAELDSLRKMDVEGAVPGARPADTQPHRPGGADGAQAAAGVRMPRSSLDWTTLR